jgi:pimeloyl-ACP methyl ester carboxylesterase
MTAPTELELAVGPFTFDAVADGPPDGEPVLLLHGFPEGAYCWRHVTPALADAGFRTVAPDQRGYSPRARPTAPDDYRMDLLVGDALGLADELGWDRFHLVGHDWGGAVAWQVAGRHPDRLRSLSVLSTPHPLALAEARAAGPTADGDDQAARGSYMDTFRADGAEDLFLADDRALLKLMLEGSAMDPESAAHCLARATTREAVAGTLNWYRGADPGDAAGLGPITTPTLYVWSTEDIALGRLAAELTAAQVAGPYRFEVLDGVSHWVPEAAPGTVADLLVAHLTSV